MKNKTIIIILLISLSIPLLAQLRDEDIFQMDYKQKSARKAMLYSTIFPGAGQLYANPKAITGYIFPVIEIGLWVGYFHYSNEGKKIERSYEKWANQEIIGYYERDVYDGPTLLFEAGDPIYRYDRIRQNYAQADLTFHSNNSFYNNHFRLDETNTQHFYEDIGKYNKYIFGWADWFEIYAYSNIDTFSVDTNIDWIWENNKWIGNNPQNSDSEYYDNPSPYLNANGIYSGMRAEYIDMRQEAERNYDKGNLMMLGTALNRVISAFDAMRVANQANMAYLSKHDVDIKLTPVFVHNHLSAGLFIQKRF
jgi:hypothetical protein